jgi:hypothetical protein
MGIDRWKQEHRNWRPNGVRFVASETPPDEPLSATPSLVPSEKTLGAKPRVAKKQAASPSGSADRSSDKIQPKRSKR